MATDGQQRAWSGGEVLALLKQTGKEWIEDRSTRQSAVIAYAALFALGPLLLITISLVSMFMGAQAARDAIVGPLSQVVGQQGADAVGALIAGEGARAGGGWIGATVGILAALVGAAGLFGALKDALNVAWEVQPEPREGWKAKARYFLVENALQILAVLVVGLLLLAAVVASVALAALGAAFEGVLPGGALAWQLLNVVASLAVLALAFGLLFRVLPDANVAWRDALTGGAATAVLFVVGQLAIGYYLGAGGLSTRYGAAGAVIVLLVWLYYTAMIVLFGAELTQVYANRHGARIRPADRTRTLQEDVRKEHDRPSREGTTRRGRRAS